MEYGDINQVNIGSGNGFLPEGTKPLLEPMFNNQHMSSVALKWGQFPKKCSWT